MRGKSREDHRASQGIGGRCRAARHPHSANYGPRYTKAFEAVFRDVAEELGHPWIEFFMEGVALNEELMQDDGIHPNAAAQPILLDNAWPVIEKASKARYT